MPKAAAQTQRLQRPRRRIHAVQVLLVAGSAPRRPPAGPTRASAGTARSLRSRSAAARSRSSAAPAAAPHTTCSRCPLHRHRPRPAAAAVVVPKPLEFGPRRRLGGSSGPPPPRSRPTFPPPHRRCCCFCCCCCRRHGGCCCGKKAECEEIGFAGAEWQCWRRQLRACGEKECEHAGSSDAARTYLSFM